MSTLLEDPVFVFMWIGFLLLMSVGTGAFFLWAIRRQQFSNQDRARYLALQSEIQLESEAPSFPGPSAEAPDARPGGGAPGAAGVFAPDAREQAPPATRSDSVGDPGERR